MSDIVIFFLGFLSAHIVSFAAFIYIYHREMRKYNDVAR